MISTQGKIFEGKNFVIADDEVMLRELIAMELEELGCQCFQVSCGDEAFEVIKNKNIDLLISDIRMPGSSGIDLLQKLKNEKKFTALPIVMMSSYSDLSLAEAEGLGALTIVAKPFLMSDIIPIIADTLK